MNNKYYKLTVLVESSEFSSNDTHLIITKTDPQDPKNTVTIQLPTPEPHFLSEGYRTGEHCETFSRDGWLIEECKVEDTLWKK